MGSLGPLEIGLIILAILLLFGYKRLPDASRSLGRSLRIFKGEMKGMKDDDVRAKDAASATPVRGEIIAPATPATPTTTASGDLTAQLHDEARIAEAHAAELRARAEQTRAADGPR
ncbi:MAG: tatA [Blastococcus sp.]|jgi:sec-independent protein translocase protein TatA|nr:tatA [Blastococcus sp.]